MRKFILLLTGLFAASLLTVAGPAPAANAAWCTDHRWQKKRFNVTKVYGSAGEVDVGFRVKYRVCTGARGGPYVIIKRVGSWHRHHGWRGGTGYQCGQYRGVRMYFAGHDGAKSTDDLRVAFTNQCVNGKRARWEFRKPWHLQRATWNGSGWNWPTIRAYRFVVKKNNWPDYVGSFGKRRLRRK